MKIFILEDNPDRISWFRDHFSGDDITVAVSCTQVDRFVGGYDIVFLDHDLGGRVLVDHEDNGEAFAKLIKDNIGHAHVIVHSYNHDGAGRILAVLPQGHRAPFCGPIFYALVANFTRTAA